MFKKGANLTLTLGLLVIGSAASADGLFEDSGDTQCTLQVVVRPAPNNQLLSKETIGKLVPTNMTPGGNANLFATQFESGVGQKISESIVAGDLFRSSALGKLTTKVEKFSQASFTAGKTASGEKINLDFQVKVAERQAVLSYKGSFVHSEVIYAVDQSSFKWTLSRAINSRTTIAWTNVATPSTSTASSILSLTHSF
jgi:hypothetical protein